MRVLFIGTGDIGLPTLQWLMASPRHEVAGVVTQPDKPVGRRQVLTAPTVKVMARAAGLPVFQPERIGQAGGDLAATRPDVGVVVAYGQILPRRVLDVPRLACLNIHASLLPRHRGAAPVQAAIREGDAQTGVSIMFMDEGLDTGDILLCRQIPIDAGETGASLHDKLAVIAPACLEEALELLASGTAPRSKQDDSLATYAGKLSREHGRIDWRHSAVEIERLIRAYDPWPGTFCSLPDAAGAARHLKVFQARVIEGEACPVPGTIVGVDPAGGLVVSCARGLIELQVVQAEGGRRLTAAEFIRGHRIDPGCRLG